MDMRQLAKTTTRTHESGGQIPRDLLDVEATRELDIARERHVGPRTSRGRLNGVLSLRGTVMHATTGYPLSDVQVVAHVRLDIDDRGSGREVQMATEVASGVTDRLGRFDIAFHDNDVTRRELALLAQGSGVALTLRVHAAASNSSREGGRVFESTPLFESDAITVDREAPVTLWVPMALEEPTAATWAMLADRMESSRQLALAEVVTQLAFTSATSSTFADWSVARRHGVLNALGEAFIDPTERLAQYGEVPTFAMMHVTGGSDDFLRSVSEAALEDDSLGEVALEGLSHLASFRGLHEVDWPVDTEELRAGKVGAALSKGKPVASSASNLSHAASLISTQVLSALDVYPVDKELVRYRDELRQILLGSPEHVDFKERHAALSTRLHQNFVTTSSKPRPANEVVAGVLTEILTAPDEEGYGLGHSKASLPERGNLTAREHVDALIEHSGASREQLETLYRIKLRRGDDELTNLVRENIATLQAFMRDGFQAKPDPYPVIPTKLLGRAPFFLYEDEWKAKQRTFYGENHFPLKRTFTAGARAEDREWAAVKASGGNEWFLDAISAEDALASGHSWAEKGLWKKARLAYEEASTFALKAVMGSRGSRAAENLGVKHAPFATTIAPIVQYVRSNSIDDAEGLEDLIHHYTYQGLPGNDPIDPGDEFNPWLESVFGSLQHKLLRLGLFIVPTSLGDLALERGEYAEAARQFKRATGVRVGRTSLSREGSWVSGSSASATAESTMVDDDDWSYQNNWRVFTDGDVPYSVDVTNIGEDPDVPNNVSSTANWDMLESLAPFLGHPVEHRFLELRYGQVMLDWADALYRTDKPGNIQRARELYKGAHFIHGFTPPEINAPWPEPHKSSFAQLLAALSSKAPAPTTLVGGGRTLQPSWSNAHRSLGASFMRVGQGALDTSSAHALFKASAQPSKSLASADIIGNVGVISANKLTASSLLKFAAIKAALNWTGNPARYGQIKRSRAGMLQIGAGLNVYGLNDSDVPTLRYATLKQAADQFALSAKSAQEDLLVYLGNVETSIEKQIVNAHALERAEYLAQISAHQVAVAKDAEKQAAQQITAVEQAIDEKRAELKSEKEFWNSAVTFVGGMIDSVKSLPEEVQDIGGAGASSAAGFGTYEASSSAGAALGAGGAAMTGYGIFVYAGVSSMVSMGEAWDSIADEIKHLENHVLPMAHKQHEIRQREVQVAQLHENVNASDVDLARDLLDFERDKFLNIDFWSELSSLMKRILHRYIDLGTRFAWQAERALAFEQDRDLDIMRLDYNPKALKGITGADLLLSDLADLEASRLDGVRHAVPLTHTFSLAFDFPLQFTQLKRTGRCTFRTSDVPFRDAAPGTYGHRVRAVSLSAQTMGGAATVRGLLSNGGESLIRRVGGAQHVMLRPAEGLPLSEFRLRRDATVFALPGETLLTFEGSGVDTTWALHLPSKANPHGLNGLADVLLTLDCLAFYSPKQHVSDLATVSPLVQRFPLFSAARWWPDALDQLREGTGPVTLELDVASAELPNLESKRRITNVLVAIASNTTLNVEATLQTSSSSARFSLVEGAALSNAGLPGDGSTTPSPLNAFVEEDAAQVFTLTIDREAHRDVDFSAIRDLVLGVEYEATVTTFPG